VREQITGNRYRKEEWTDAITTVGGDVQMDGRIDLLGVQHWTWGGTFYRDTSDNGYQRWQTAVGNLNPATATNATTGLLEDQSTTLPDNSTYIGQALFVQNDWRFDERWNAVAGLRWSRSSWNAFVRNGRTGFVGDQNIHGSADAWTGSLRLGWQVLDPVLVYGGASQGFRAPSLTDIAGDTVSPVAGITTRPNPDLQAERAITYEIGAKAEDGPQRASLALFWTRISNQIQGQYIDSDGNGSIDTGRPVNGLRADLRGFELAFDATVPGIDVGTGRRLSVFNTITAVDGESRVQAANGTTARANVPRANLVWGQAGVKYQAVAWYTLAQVRWAGRYGEATPEQGSDPRFYTVRGDVTSSDGSVPGWAVLDLKAGWTASAQVRVDAGIENVLDRTYRSAGSSADGTGLNGVLTVSARY
jgi:outer membrane receptor protein involved in Fe transport